MLYRMRKMIRFDLYSWNWTWNFNQLSTEDSTCLKLIKSKRKKFRIGMQKGEKMWNQERQEILDSIVIYIIRIIAEILNLIAA